MALPALATATDLANRLGVPMWTGDELTQIKALLDDASAELRAVTGQPLSLLTSSVTLFADEDGVVELPAFPVVDVTSVEVDGDPVTDFQVRGRLLLLPARQGDEIAITYDHGWDPIPDELVKWTCVLAASALSAVNSTGSLGMAAGISAEAIDDYRVSFARGEQAGHGMVLPDRIAARLRAAYGAGGMAVVAQR